MKRIILLAAAALPLAGQAENVATPALPSYLVVDVEFWGTISAVGRGTRRVGEAINGSMRIDMRLAPSDFWDDSSFPNDGEYIWNPPCPGTCPPDSDAPSRFVTTRGAGAVELGGNSWDRVFVYDTTEGEASPNDEFSVRDFEDNASVGAYSELRVELGAFSRVIDFIHGDDLLQDFDLRLAEAGGGTRASGRWSEVLNGMTQLYFEFTIDRLRVAPKVCRI